MLNKQICIKCCNKHNASWCDYDEKRWIHGLVLCPEQYTLCHIDIDIKEIPPNNCPYKLEHIISDKEINNAK